MRRVATRLTFEPLDRRENPGTSWGLFSLLGVVSSALDHSHSKAKPAAKANHAHVAGAVETTKTEVLAVTTHPDHAAVNHHVRAEAVTVAKHVH